MYPQFGDTVLIFFCFQYNLTDPGPVRSFNTGSSYIQTEIHSFRWTSFIAIILKTFLTFFYFKASITLNLHVPIRCASPSVKFNIF